MRLVSIDHSQRAHRDGTRVWFHKSGTNNKCEMKTVSLLRKTALGKIIDFNVKSELGPRT